MDRSASNTGSIALSVFPVPVGAIKTTFFPSWISGIAWVWACESSEKPRFFIDSWIFGSSLSIGFIRTHRTKRADICPVGKDNLSSLFFHTSGYGGKGFFKNLKDIVSCNFIKRRNQ